MTDDNVTSLGFNRAKMSNDASKWNAEDLLIEALRAVRAGEIKPEEIILVYRELGPINVSYYRAGSDRHVSAGMLFEVAGMMVKKS